METMTQVTPAVVVMSDEDRLKQQVTDLQQANGLLKTELSALRSEYPISTMSGLQSKIGRQALALTRLQASVRRQRLVLRELTDLGRELSDDEWAALRSKQAELTDCTSLYV
jgi:hypothetical protein